MLRVITCCQVRPINKSYFKYLVYKYISQITNHNSHLNHVTLFFTFPLLLLSLFPMLGCGAIISYRRNWFFSHALSLRVTQGDILNKASAKNPASQLGRLRPLEAFLQRPIRLLPVLSRGPQPCSSAKTSAAASAPSTTFRPPSKWTKKTSTISVYLSSFRQTQM